jgi:hypothetical protein
MTGPTGLNEQIMVHARNATWWRHHKEAERLYSIFSAANAVLFNADLPAAVIGFDDDGRLQKDGAYTFEGDDIGLKHHIDLRKGLEGVQMVVALLHQMVHLHQETYQEKKTWYHSTKFRQQMKAMGIQVGSDGEAKAILPGFAATLNKIGMGGLLEEVEGYEPTVVVAADEEEVSEPEPQAAISESPVFASIATPAQLEGPAKFGWSVDTKLNDIAGASTNDKCFVCGAPWVTHNGWECIEPAPPQKQAVVWQYHHLPQKAETKTSPWQGDDEAGGEGAHDYHHYSHEGEAPTKGHDDNHSYSSMPHIHPAGKGTGQTPSSGKAIKPWTEAVVVDKPTIIVASPTVPVTAFALPPKKPSTSKMKKWSCHCTNVRAAVSLDMTCNKCGYNVELQD